MCIKSVKPNIMSCALEKPFNYAYYVKTLVADLATLKWELCIFITHLEPELEAFSVFYTKFWHKTIRIVQKNPVSKFHYTVWTPGRDIHMNCSCCCYYYLHSSWKAFSGISAHSAGAFWARALTSVGRPGLGSLLQFMPKVWSGVRAFLRVLLLWHWQTMSSWTFICARRHCNP